MTDAVKTYLPGPVEPGKLYSYAELAEAAGEGITERRIRRWVEEGRLGHVQLPKGRRVQGAQFLDFIAGRSVAPVE